MKKKVIRGRLIRVIPAALVLWAVALLCAALGGAEYGHYMFLAPVELNEHTKIPGTYVSVKVSGVQGTYARYGHAADSDGSEDYTLRYVAVKVGDDIIGVRLTRSQQKLLADPGATLKGTLLKSSPSEILPMLREWVTSGEWSGRDPVDVGRHTPDIMLFAGYKGSRHSAAGLTLWLLFMLFTAFGISVLLVGIHAINCAGRVDEANCKMFGTSLIISPKSVLILRLIAGIEIPRGDVTRAFPRSKRLEGGRIRRTLVFEVHGKEVALRLPSEDMIKDALEQLTVNNEQL